MSDEELSVLLVGVSALYLGISLGHRAVLGTWFGEQAPVVAAAGLLSGLVLFAEARWRGGRGSRALDGALGAVCIVAGGYWLARFLRSPPTPAPTGLGSLSTVAWLGGGAAFVALCGVGIAGGDAVRRSPWFVRGVIGVSALAFAGLFGVVVVSTGLY